MDDDEDQEKNQRLTAYHEAGHAVAVANCPQGRVDEIDVGYNELVGEWLGQTLHDHRDEDQAFIIYAGPWAHARAEWPEETIDVAHVEIQYRRNFSDWRAYERAKGGDVSAVDAYELALDEAVMARKACDAVPAAYNSARC